MKGLLLIFCALCAYGLALAAEKPNFIFILADDRSIPGVGCYGGIYKTPQLAALAAGGIRFAPLGA